MQKLPVYVVSLREAADRRESMRKHLDGLGIEFEFFDAVRGAELDPAYRNEVNPSGNMSPGQLGCYLSHIKIYEKMQRDCIPIALILEDDTVLHHSVQALVRNECQSLNFDYCFLGCEDRGDEGYVFYDATSTTKLTDQKNIYLLSSGPYCTNAYLITNQGAKRRLSCAYPARTAIDHYHFLPYRPKFMATIPLLAFVSEQSAVGSMSSVTWSGLEKEARKYWWYYPLRDILKLKPLKKLAALRTANSPRPGNWKIFESGFKIVRQSRYMQRMS